jgi:hypothetical protein
VESFVEMEWVCYRKVLIVGIAIIY